uniref:Protein sleepless n=1 Tax=Rhabditophanes sp. KR3021 TaxID=114890 RepID=A0AC35U4X1_9BILA
MLIQFVILIAVPILNGLRCHKCNGYDSSGYPRDISCDNLNNYCETSYFCVKVVDPMRLHSSYQTFKSTCFDNSFFLQNHPNRSKHFISIKDNQCYKYSEGFPLLKQFTLCFCNTDYCNSQEQSIKLTYKYLFIAISGLIVMLLIIYMIL